MLHNQVHIMEMTLLFRRAQRKNTILGRQLLRDGCIEVGYCPRPNEVDFRVIAPSIVLVEVTPQVYAPLGENTASSRGETLEQVVVGVLRKSKEPPAVAASCTGR
ncbi:MAG: hypothetical protein C5B47_08130 [Verrucomicrobia bacterium]|nr:MAG: hypothetical protein C5B47_08130 [Verrucomicrobiota bacterium]